MRRRHLILLAPARRRRARDRRRGHRRCAGSLQSPVITCRATSRRRHRPERRVRRHTRQRQRRDDVDADVRRGTSPASGTERSRSVTPPPLPATPLTPPATRHRPVQRHGHRFTDDVDPVITVPTGITVFDAAPPAVANPSRSSRHGVTTSMEARSTQRAAMQAGVRSPPVRRRSPALRQTLPATRPARHLRRHRSGSE